MKIKHYFNILLKKIINSNLPVYVEKFNNFYVIKILGVIGNISIIIFLFLSQLIRNSYLYLIIITLSMIYFIYILFISITKISYIIYIKDKKEIRNFILDQKSFLTIKLTTYIKWACVCIFILLTLGFWWFNFPFVLLQTFYIIIISIYIIRNLYYYFIMLKIKHPNLYKTLCIFIYYLTLITFIIHLFILFFIADQSYIENIETPINIKNRNFSAWCPLEYPDHRLDVRYYTEYREYWQKYLDFNTMLREVCDPKMREAKNIYDDIVYDSYFNVITNDYTIVKKDNVTDLYFENKKSRMLLLSREVSNQVDYIHSEFQQVQNADFVYFETTGKSLSGSTPKKYNDIHQFFDQLKDPKWIFSKDYMIKHYLEEISKSENNN